MAQLPLNNRMGRAARVRALAECKPSVNQQSLPVRPSDIRIATLGPDIMFKEYPFLSLSVSKHLVLTGRVRLISRAYVSIEEARYRSIPNRQDEWRKADRTAWYSRHLFHLAGPCHKL